MKAASLNLSIKCLFKMKILNITFLQVQKCLQLKILKCLNVAYAKYLIYI